jgi:hypothetical protein
VHPKGAIVFRFMSHLYTYKYLPIHLSDVERRENPKISQRNTKIETNNKQNNKKRVENS